ncbi:MAG: HAD-IC family P-type ATPase, partial [Lentisphaeria bacterium]
KLDKIKVIARSNPATKLRVVDLLMKCGHSVAVTGDGINDAPALKRAEVGIAMGITGTEVSKETADIVLLDDSFSTIVKAIEGGRGLYENIQKFIQFQQTVNIAALFLVLIFEILGWPTPLSPLQLLWINIIMDGPLAVSLSFEKTRSDIMSEKPRKSNTSIISQRGWSNIICSAFYIIASITALIYFLDVDPDYVSTFSFCLLIFMVIFNLYNCKESTNQSVLNRIFDNKKLNITVLITVIVQFFILTYLSSAFSVKNLSVVEYFTIVLFSSTIIIFVEATKFIQRNIMK